jgi:hypothetical protein
MAAAPMVSARRFVKSSRVSESVKEGARPPQACSIASRIGMAAICRAAVAPNAASTVAADQRLSIPSAKALKSVV